MINIPNENDSTVILDYPPYPEVATEEATSEYHKRAKRTQQNLRLLSSFKTERDRLRFILDSLELLYQKSNSPE